jgi:hypothetical protein
MVTGILLILSIIDFALTAPVLAHEKRQARVEVVHIPKDVTTVLGKRWGEVLEKLGEEYFEISAWGFCPPCMDRLGSLGFLGSARLSGLGSRLLSRVGTSISP